MIINIKKKNRPQLIKNKIEITKNSLIFTTMQNTEI